MSTCKTSYLSFTYECGTRNEAEDLASKIEDQENLAFSDDFYNKFCELKD